MEVATKSENKSDFVREFLSKHPESNVKAVNEAWTAAGMSGTIGETLIYGTRADMGLSGKLRAKSKPSATGKKLGRRRKETTAAVNVQPRGNRSTILDDLEADIDRLLFKAMAIGDLTEIENSLRRARRLLYGAMTGG